MELVPKIGRKGGFGCCLGPNPQFFETSVRFLVRDPYHASEKRTEAVILAVRTGISAEGSRTFENSPPLRWCLVHGNILRVDALLVFPGDDKMEPNSLRGQIMIERSENTPSVVQMAPRLNQGGRHMRHGSTGIDRAGPPSKRHGSREERLHPIPP